jgi:hypothetical protein
MGNQNLLKPFDQNNPFMPPMMPPPSSVGSGFQTWATDPNNAMKIQPSMTSPSAPLQPNAGMAAANPPGAQPPAPQAPPPPVPTQEQDMAANPGEYQRPTVRGKGTAIANMLVAGLAGAAGGLNNRDPLAGLRYAQGVQQHDENVPSANSDTYATRILKPQQQKLQTDKTTADIAHTKAETDAIPVNQKIRQMAAAGTLAQHGLKLQDNLVTGTTEVVPDENSPVYKQQQTKQQLAEAQIEAAKAGVELKNAQTALAKSKNDPNSPAFKMAQQRLQIAQSNAAAATTRATAYMGNYLKGAFNTDLQGNTLPGAPVISDEGGNQTVVGATNAGTAIKNQGNAAQFNDVHGALDILDQTAEALHKSGGSVNSPGVAAALARPAGTLGQWLQGEGVKANLTPAERAYVQAIASAHENIQALRKSAGGTATDSAVEKLDAMIPNASTPDLDYLKGQTHQIRMTAERLGKGAVVSAGGLSVRGQKAAPAAGNALKPPTGAAVETYVRDPKTGKLVKQ